MLAIFFAITPILLTSQQNSTIAKCGFLDASKSSESDHCSNTSHFWKENYVHIPNDDSGIIKIRVNFIICQRSDGSANFQNNATDLAFLNEWVDYCNGVLTLWQTNSTCNEPTALDSKIQIVPNFIFNANTDYWDNDQDQSLAQCPPLGDDPNWWLFDLDQSIFNNPSIPKGINVFLTVPGNAYNLFTSGAIDNPEPYMKGWWCSNDASRTDFEESIKIHIGNLYMKYVWFQDPDFHTPFSVSRGWLIGSGLTLAHEIIHCFGADDGIYGTHFDNCTNNIMNTDAGGLTLTVGQVGMIHRWLATSSLRQFVECDETYNDGGAYITERIVEEDEKWDLNMRMYSDVRVKEGATLTVSCKLLMPENGVIHVERGARLLVDGGEIWRANTCSPSEYWGRIALEGNNKMIQPAAGSTPPPGFGGIVELKNEALLEGAVVGISTFKNGQSWNSDYWGGLVESNNAIFQDCRKGVEFMKYDFPNASNFRDTRFLQTGSGSSHTGVSIWDTDGIAFRNTKFYGMQNFGIDAGDAVITMGENCEVSGSKIGVLLNHTNPVPSGVSEIGAANPKVSDRNQFQDNSNGIVVLGTGLVDVLYNDFEDYDIDLSVGGEAITYSEENSFSGKAVGTQFIQTEFKSNKLNCNKYNSNVVGTNIQGENIGYRFNYEEFSTGWHDLFIESIKNGGLGKILVFQGSPQAALLNSFSTNHGADIQHSLNAPWNTAQEFNYYAPPDMRYIPQCAKNVNSCGTPSGIFNLRITGGASSFACGKKLDVCTGEACWVDIRKQIQQSFNLLQSGNSPTVKAAAQSFGSSAINTLLNASPYLSDDVLRAVIQNAQFSDGDKMDVLLSNAPLSLFLLDELSNQLATVDIERLKSISEGVSERAKIQYEFESLSTREASVIQELLTSFIKANQWDIAEQILLDNQDNSNTKRLFGLMMQKGDYVKAEQYLLSLPIETEQNQAFVEIQKINLSRYLAKEDFILTAADEQKLLNFAESNFAEKYLAQSLLTQLKGYVFLPPLPILDGSQGESREQLEYKDAKALNSDFFAVYPNPADDLVRFEFSTNELGEQYNIKLYASDGQLVKHIELSDIQNIRVDTKALANGVYFICFSKEGKLIERKSLIVQH